MNNQELAKQRSSFNRVLTWLSALALPSIYFFYHQTHSWSAGKTVVLSLLTVVIFRAALDMLMRIVLPPPSLFGNDDVGARADDIMTRRRFWFWRFWGRAGMLYTVLCLITMKHGFVHQLAYLLPHLANKVSHPSFLLQFIQVGFLFAANFLIFMGPMMMMGISQIKTFEPGDANWGVRLDDVRGQKEPKEEVRRVVEIWQSGEDFERLGGKRERGMLFLGPPGVGKGQPLTGLVQTPYGPLPMGSMRVGGSVLGSDGQPTTIVDVVELGERDIFLVSFSDGSSLRVTEDHLWQISMRGWSRVVDTKWLGSHKLERDTGWKYRIPASGAAAYNTSVALPLHPYLLGALLGDGSFREDGVTISSNDPLVIQLVQSLLPEEDSLTLRGDKRSPGLRVGYVCGVRDGNPSRTKVAVDGMGLWRLRSEEKFIPTDYLLGSIEERTALLQGLMDTDGWTPTETNTMTFSTSSPRLRDGFTTLVQSLGGTVTWTSKQTTGLEHYVGRVCLPNEIVPYLGARAHHLRDRSFGLPRRYVVSVTPDGREEARCIKVEAANQLYLAGDEYVVTHNTMAAKAIATSFNAPFITIPGSGFAQTFIGIDAIIVRFLARKAKKVARKWGGQCIVFIDEIDAVGMRRNSLGGGMAGGIGGMMGGMMGGQMALNQLLVVMDSIDSPPALKMFFTKKVNLLLDASYFVPRRVGRIALRLPPLRPRRDAIFFIGATNVPLENLDPALVRAGRMGRHVWFRNPTKDDRKDVFDLYMAKVSHDAELDSPERRDEIARITQGTSPASIEQICSMALLNAQNDGRRAFSFSDLVEALTTLEAGTAVGVEYTEKELLAVALHEAGHATAAHVYRTQMESSRLSVRMRGSSLGHHQSFEKEERFGSWRHEDFGNLVHGLAAMATEYVFYGENGRGVSGDLGQATSLVAQMVGISGMTPYHSEEDELTKKFEQIGSRLLNRSHAPAGSAPDPIGVIISDRVKGRDAALFLGHAFVTAWNFIRVNKDAVERVANKLVEEREIFGNDLNALLDEQGLVRFDYEDITNFHKADAWPVM